MCKMLLEVQERIVQTEWEVSNLWSGVPSGPCGATSKAEASSPSAVCGADRQCAYPLASFRSGGSRG